jgi:hypothetical protein
MNKKRTKKDYDQLYRSPKHLFPPTASSAGVDTILFPNGQNEIWFKDEYGRHFTVVASSGPAGFSVTVKAGFNASATLLGAKYPGYECFDEDDVKEVTLCQYNQDEASQTFKAWYLADASNKENRKRFSVQVRDADNKLCRTYSGFSTRYEAETEANRLRDEIKQHGWNETVHVTESHIVSGD